MIIDMHVHSTMGPGGRAKPSAYAKRIRDYLRPTGNVLDGFVLTEHDKYCKTSFADDLKQKYGVSVFSGVEVNTRYGHAILLGVKDNSFRAQKLRDSQELVDWADDNNCLVIPAHPFSNNGHSLWKHELDNIEGIKIVEGLNASLHPRNNLDAVLYAQEHGLKTTGGSDAHILRQLGQCVTYFDNEIATMDDLLEALEHSNFSAKYTKGYWRRVEHDFYRHPKKIRANK